jgi:hypothetical protein
MRASPDQGTAFSTTDQILRAAAGIVVTEVKRATESELRAATEAIHRTAQSAVQQLAVAARETSAALTREIGAASSRLADHAESLQGARAKRPVAFAVAAASFAALLLTVGSYLAGYTFGAGDREAAREERIIKDTKTRTWALSPAGREARALDRTLSRAGGVSIFARCTGPGWQVKTKRGVRRCYVPAGAWWALP